MLKASALTRRFGARVAVDGVSFEIVRGEILALLGPNGAGKTTTLRMLAGLIAPTSGVVRVGDEPLTTDSAPRLRARIGFLTEAPGLWDRLTIRQNLEVYARLHGLGAADTAVDTALDLFDIRARAAQKAAQLSKGLKQRVALARTLLHRPDIVLLDEPTSGLDPESAREVRDLVLRLRDEGRAVLLSTHNLDEVERVATRVAVLRTTLLAVDTPAALRARLFRPSVRITLASAAERFVPLLLEAGTSEVTADGFTLTVVAAPPADLNTPAMVTRLVGAGAAIESVTPDQPSLEDVYLRLIREPARGA